MSEEKAIPLKKIVPEDGVLIEFPGLSPTAAGKAAAQLETQINTSAERVSKQRPAAQTRVKPGAQDLGTVVGTATTEAGAEQHRGYG